MSNIVHLKAPRGQDHVHFAREEFGLLLTIYSRRVIGGEWKDYAIAHGPRRATFCIFKDASRRPAFTVVKQACGRGEAEYMLLRADTIVSRAKTLSEVLTPLLGPNLRLVSS